MQCLVKQAPLTASCHGFWCVLKVFLLHVVDGLVNSLCVCVRIALVAISS